MANLQRQAYDKDLKTRQEEQTKQLLLKREVERIEKEKEDLVGGWSQHEYGGAHGC
jgi:hypothetical protein